jgi:hypothetical protein
MEAVGERSEFASTRHTVFIMLPARSKAYIFSAITQGPLIKIQIFGFFFWGGGVSVDLAIEEPKSKSFSKYPHTTFKN